MNSRVPWVPWGIPWQETGKKMVSARSDFLRETSSLIRLLSELQSGGGLISYPFSHIKLPLLTKGPGGRSLTARCGENGLML